MILDTRADRSRAESAVAIQLMAAGEEEDRWKEIVDMDFEVRAVLQVVKSKVMDDFISRPSARTCALAR